MVYYFHEKFRKCKAHYVLCEPKAHCLFLQGVLSLNTLVNFDEKINKGKHKLMFIEFGDYIDVIMFVEKLEMALIGSDIVIAAFIPYSYYYFSLFTVTYLN